MSLTIEQQEALSEYSRCLRVLDDGADSQEEFDNQHEAAKAAHDHCRKLRIPAEYGIAHPRMITLFQTETWPQQRRMSGREYLGSFFSVESAEDKLGWYFVHNCCEIQDF